MVKLLSCNAGLLASSNRGDIVIFRRTNPNNHILQACVDTRLVDPSLCWILLTFSPSMARLVTVIDTCCHLSEGLNRLREVCEAMPTQQA